MNESSLQDVAQPRSHTGINSNEAYTGYKQVTVTCTVLPSSTDTYQTANVITITVDSALYTNVQEPLSRTVLGGIVCIDNPKTRPGIRELSYTGTSIVQGFITKAPSLAVKLSRTTG